MSSNSVTVLMDGAKKTSLLSRDEEFALAEQMNSADPYTALAARNTLITANIRFVTHLAHGYVKSSESALEDFVSAGLEAMVKNANKFDPNKANFCTFMKPWIKKAFQEMRYSDTAIAIPRHRHISINKIRRTMERLAIEHGPFVDITNEMVADEAGLSVDDISEALSVHGDFLTHTPSLDAPIADVDGVTLLETVADRLVAADESDLSDSMLLALSVLTPDEAQVIMMTAGLDGTGDMSNTEIAQSMTRSRCEALVAARFELSQAVCVWSPELSEADLAEVTVTAARVRALLASARKKMTVIL